MANLNLNGREVPLQARGSFFRFYKRKFGTNPLNDIIKMVGGFEVLKDKDNVNLVEIVENLDTSIVENLTYAMACQGDKSFEEKYPTVEEFLDEFEDFPIIDVLQQIAPLLHKTLSSNVEPKKKA